MIDALVHRIPAKTESVYDTEDFTFVSIAVTGFKDCLKAIVLLHDFVKFFSLCMRHFLL